MHQSNNSTAISEFALGLQHNNERMNVLEEKLTEIQILVAPIPTIAKTLEALLRYVESNPKLYVLPTPSVFTKIQGNDSEIKEEEGELLDFELLIPEFFFEEMEYSSVVEIPPFFFAEDEEVTAKLDVINPSDFSEAYGSFKDWFVVGCKWMGKYHSTIIFGYNRNLFDRGKGTDYGYQPEFWSKRSSMIFCGISAEFLVERKLLDGMSAKTMNFTFLLIVGIVISCVCVAGFLLCFFLSKVCEENIQGLSLEHGYWLGIGSRNSFASIMAKDGISSTACQVFVKILQMGIMCSVNKNAIKHPLLCGKSSYDCFHLTGRVIDRGKKFKFVMGLSHFVGGFVCQRLPAKSVRLMKGYPYNLWYQFAKGRLLVEGAAREDTSEGLVKTPQRGSILKSLPNGDMCFYLQKFWSTDYFVLLCGSGATKLKMLVMEHPAAKVLVELDELQAREVRDGTTSVVIGDAELLKRAKELVRNKINPTLWVKTGGMVLRTVELCMFCILLVCGWIELLAKIVGTQLLLLGVQLLFVYCVWRDHLKWKFKVAVACFLAHIETVTPSSRWFTYVPQGLILLRWYKLTVTEFDRRKLLAIMFGYPSFPGHKGCGLEISHKYGCRFSSRYGLPTTPRILGGELFKVSVVIHLGGEELQITLLEFNYHTRLLLPVPTSVSSYFYLLRRGYHCVLSSYNQIANFINFAEGKYRIQSLFFERRIPVLFTVTLAPIESQVVEFFRWKFKSVSTSLGRMTNGNETTWISIGLCKGRWGRCKMGWYTVGFSSLCLDTNMCFVYCQSVDIEIPKHLVANLKVKPNWKWVTAKGVFNTSVVPAEETLWLSKCVICVLQQLQHESYSSEDTAQLHVIEGTVMATGMGLTVVSRGEMTISDNSSNDRNQCILGVKPKASSTQMFGSTIKCVSAIPVRLIKGCFSNLWYNHAKGLLLVDNTAIKDTSERLVTKPHRVILVGLDKILVDDIGDVKITKDGAIILKMLEVEHEAAKLIAELDELQDRVVGEGVVSVVIVAAELLKRANEPVWDKIHPTSISRWFLGILKVRGNLTRVYIDSDVFLGQLRERESLAVHGGCVAQLIMAVDMSVKAAATKSKFAKGALISIYSSASNSGGRHTPFLVQAMYRLYKPKCIAVNHQQLSYCITRVLEEDCKLTSVDIWFWNINTQQPLFSVSLKQQLTKVVFGSSYCGKETITTATDQQEKEQEREKMHMNSSWVISQEFLDKHNIDYVVHDSKVFTVEEFPTLSGILG